MSSESLSNSEESKALELKRDIEQLFSNEYSKIIDSNQGLASMFTRTVYRRFIPKIVPSEASTIAGEDYTIQNGSLGFNLIRAQWIKISRISGKELITEDTISCSLTDNAWDNRPETNTEIAYAYSADMLQRSIPYDERFERIIKACLEQAS